MPELTGAWGLVASLGGSIAAGTLGALALLFLQRFLGPSPILRKALWIILGLKLLFPLGFITPAQGISQLFSDSSWNHFVKEVPGHEEVLVSPSSQATLAWNENKSKTWESLVPKIDPLVLGLGAAYLGGTLISLIFFGSRLLSARYLIRQAKGLAGEDLQKILEESKTALEYHKPVKLLLSDLTPGPVSWGVFRPVILLPPDWANKLQEPQIRGIFHHELAHLKAGDPVFLGILDFICALFWFHPGFWFLGSQLRLNAELAADRKAAATAPSPQFYGETLLHALGLYQTSTPLAGARAMAESAEGLKTRIRHIRDVARTRNSPWAMIMGLGLGILLMGTSFGSSSPRMPPVVYDRASFFRYASVLMDEMEWEKAAKIYQALLVISPGDEAASEILARILILQEKYDQALGVMAEVEKSGPWAWITSARIKDFLGLREEALGEYQETLDYRRPQESIRRLAATGLKRPLHPRKTYPFTLPESGRLIPQGWEAWASDTHRDRRASMAFDGDLNTRWSTSRAMTAGDHFTLDLGRLTDISALVLIDDAGGNTIYTNDYPRNWKILISRDGSSWISPAQGQGIPDIYAGAAFDPIRGRYVRLELEGSSQGEYWSIYELQLW